MTLGRDIQGEDMTLGRDTHGGDMTLGRDTRGRHDPGERHTEIHDLGEGYKRDT